MRIGSPRKAPDIGKNTNMKYAAEWLAAVTLFLAFAYNVSVLYLPPPEGAQPLDVVFRTLAVALCGYFTGIAFSGNKDGGDFRVVMAFFVVFTVSLASAAILLAVRFTVEITAANIAAATQFRDIMSIGIGSAIASKKQIQA